MFEVIFKSKLWLPLISCIYWNLGYNWFIVISLRHTPYVRHKSTKTGQKADEWRHMAKSACWGVYDVYTEYIAYQSTKPPQRSIRVNRNKRQKKNI